MISIKIIIMTFVINYSNICKKALHFSIKQKTSPCHYLVSSMTCFRFAMFSYIQCSKILSTWNVSAQIKWDRGCTNTLWEMSFPCPHFWESHDQVTVPCFSTFIKLHAVSFNAEPRYLGSKKIKLQNFHWMINLY